MLTRPPSFRAVAAFEAAARHESFAKAADELNLTHSAISHAIRSLELRLGSQLFDRVGRTVALTEEGANLAKRVRASLSLLTDAFDRRPHPGRTRLVIGVDAGLASRLLAPRLGAFQALQPQIGIELRSVMSTAALAGAEIDLAIRSGSGWEPGVATRVIARERLCPVAAPWIADTFDLTSVPSGRLIESQQHPWSLWFAQAHTRPSMGAPAVSVDTDLMAIELAKAGGGVCLAPSLLVQPDLTEGSLVRLSRDEAPARSAYILDWNPMSAKLDEIALFATWMAEALTTGAAGRAPLVRAPRDANAA